MIPHTLILSKAKVEFPKLITIDFVANLINHGLTEIEYFGIELDNQEDFVDDDIKMTRAENTYIEFYFDTEESIDYDLLTLTEVERFIDNIIKKADKIDLRVNKKDITVYL